MSELVGIDRALDELLVLLGGMVLRLAALMGSSWFPPSILP